MAGCYELKTAVDGQFFFHLLAGNGQIILSSEMYKSRDAAMNGIESVRNNCGEHGQYECKTSENGKPYFVLKAKNHQVIGQSQMYSSEDACNNGVESVKTNGGSDQVKDSTAD